MEDAISHGIKCLSLPITVKDFQKDVIASYMLGKDCFCTAGTGAGKSLTYILCPFVSDFKSHNKCVTRDNVQSVALIIQPLKSLMKDQHKKMISLGLKATYVGEDHDFDGMTSQQYNYIIVSPESAISSRFLDLTDSIGMKIACIFVDESHCIQTL